MHKQAENSYDRSMWILLLALFAPFTPTLDLYVAGYFYSPEYGFYDNVFFHGLFKYGEWFGLATGGAAASVFLITFFLPKWKKFRRGALAMVLTLVIGAGLITNVGFKGHWGRPRPKQIEEFGGTHLYRPFWRPNFHTKADPQKSFPSGHVAMGFYFLSLCLVGRRYNSKLMFNVGLFLTLLLGGGLMIARVAQGGHFVSDVIVSPILMWYVAKGIVKITWAGSARQGPGSKQSGTSAKPEPA